MRTDVKVGLICVFVLVLAVVAYFAFQSNPDKQKTPQTSTVVTGTTPDGGASLAATPVVAATTTAPSMTAPETPIAGGGMLMSPRTTALAQVAPADNQFTGPVIAPPGTPASAPAPEPTPLIATPPIPATGPALETPQLLPPGPGTPAVPTPSSNYTPAPPPRSTIDLSPPPRRTSTPAFETPLPGPTDFSPAPTGAATTYVIQKGDMLGAIAKKNGVTLKALEAANPGINPNKLKINSKITIPAATPAAPTTPATPASPTTRPARNHATTKPATTKPAGKTTITPGTSYTVKSGDTLRKIAKAAYGDENAWRRIFRANRGDMSDANDLTVGQVIKIPK